MIYSVSGTLLVSEPSLAVVECSGVGYKCNISLNTAKHLPKVGDNVFLYTYLNVREDAVDLFGFYDKKECDAFKMLTSVSGVGPKAGLSILSEFTPDTLAVALASADAKALTRASGVGIKLAQRIVLELKGKIANDDITFSEESAVNTTGGGSFGEAVSALTSLGYTASEASAALKGAPTDATTEELIKTGLKYFSGRR